MVIQNDNGHLTTSVFHKPTAEPYILPYTSNHPRHGHRNIPYAALRRAHPVLNNFNEWLLMTCRWVSHMKSNKNPIVLSMLCRHVPNPNCWNSMRLSSTLTRGLGLILDWARVRALETEIELESSTSWFELSGKLKKSQLSLLTMKGGSTASKSSSRKWIKEISIGMNRAAWKTHNS